MSLQVVSGSQIGAAMRSGAEEALGRFALELLAAAVKEAPPSPAPDRDPDPNVTLKDTGRVHVERAGGQPVVVVAFETAYAAKIHENVRAKHPKGGKAKFLEDPLKARLGSLQGIVAADVHKRLSAVRGR